MTKGSISLLLLLLILIPSNIYFFIKANQCKVLDANDTYKNGWEAAKKRLTETGYFDYSGGLGQVTTITGVVEKVEGDKIYFSTRPLEPLGEPGLDHRLVVAANGTEISVYTKKDPVKYSAEVKAYIEKHGNTLTGESLPEGYPNQYDINSGGVNDAKPGNQVIVESEKDIKISKEITASKVIIYGF